MGDCGNVKKVFVAAAPTPSEPVSFSGIQITDVAAEKICRFCAVDQKDPQEYGLKISVVNDGCSGKSYTMDLAAIANSVEFGDKIFSHNGATVMVEKLSYLFVTGSILDYKETLLMSGFELRNPNVKKSCSCGSSFSV